MNIYRKAKAQYQSGMVTYKGKGKNKEYYTVKDLNSNKEHEITIETKEYGTTATCDCMNKSFHIDKPNFCSHIISVINYIYFHTKIN